MVQTVIFVFPPPVPHAASRRGAPAPNRTSAKEAPRHVGGRGLGRATGDRGQA